MKKITRWPYLVAGSAVTLFLGFIYTWSVFRIYFSADFPQWSVSQLSMNFTLANTFSCMGAFFSGKLISRMSSRKVAIISALLIFIGFMGASLIKTLGGSIYVLYLLYGILGSIGLGMSYNLTVNLPAKWYPEKSGLISGFILMAIGLGTLALSAVVERMAEAFGVYTSLRICAILISGCILVCCHWLVAPGVDVELPAPRNGKVVATSGKSMTSKETVRTRSFWLFFLWNVCLSAGGLLVINSAANIAVYYGAAVIVGMLVSIANSAGRLIFGSVSDKIGGQRAMMMNGLVLLFGGSFMLVGALLEVPVLVILGLLLDGAAFGSNMTLRVTVLGERYGKEHSAENFGICNLCVIPASILGPLVSGMLIDAQGGSYTGTFALVILLAVLALILNILFIKTKDK